MFFEGDRIKAIREMIVAKTPEARKAALDKILPYQQGDFEAMYRVLEGRPMTVRFLDPPLHEFVPQKEEDIVELAGELKISVDELKAVIAGLHEFNPMMGHRAASGRNLSGDRRNADHRCDQRGPGCEQGASGIQYRS